MAYERVLVASDFSSASSHGASAARSVAPPGARFRVVHVMRPTLPFDGLPMREVDSMEAYAHERRARFEGDLESWARKCGFDHATVKVRAGSVAREVGREADDFEADLVALGARGLSRVEQLLVGSTTRAVIHRATDIDVLIGRTGGPISRVLVATDFQPPSRDAARRALDIAKVNGAQLLVIHALESGPMGEAMRPQGAPDARQHDELREWARKELHAFNARELEGRAIEVLLEGRPAHEVVAFAREHDVSLVCVGAHGGSALERVLIGSVAESISERAHCATLLVR